MGVGTVRNSGWRERRGGERKWVWVWLEIVGGGKGGEVRRNGRGNGEK